MKEKVVEAVEKVVDLKKDEILSLIESPPDSKLGDYAFPCFTLAKGFKKNPAEIAKHLSKKIKSKNFEKIEAIGPYINFFLNRNFLTKETLKKIKKEGNKFGRSNTGKNKKILIEFSSPNIGKPFGVHHLRSTIIGNSIANICSLSGFNVIKLNYLGDWGTQFGKLIVGFKKFGNEKKLKEDPINHLLDVYIKASKDPNLEDEARLWFKKMESGDKGALKLWKTFKSLSLKEFDKIYKELGIEFDLISGESLYNKKLKSVLVELNKKNLLEESQGARIVNLEKYNLGVCIIEKSDGTTLYATRDIAAAIERHEKYNSDLMIYEVGSDQKLHFKQVFKILELLGYSWAKNLIHIDHGLYLDKDGKKFATREGKMIFLDDILKETKALAKKEILKREKNISSTELDKRASAILLAAILYGDLKNYRVNDALFDIERFVSFEGDTGPYLLYTYARSRSILEKAKYNKTKSYEIKNLDDLEKNLILQLGNFPEIVKNSFNNLSPHVIANYAFQLSQTFNEFYHATKVIGSENEQFKLFLVDSFSQVLKNALSLLGIPVIEKM